MKWKLLFLLLFGLYISHAQNFKQVYQHQVDQPFIKLVGEEDMDFHIAASGKFLVMGTNEWIKVLDSKGEMLFNYTCLPKSNDKTRLAAQFFEGMTSINNILACS
ncbi:MAG: hypothetical protein ACNS62_02530 [Candidatus Cyclobacteriaceae bacterium M3_2C_046]